MVGFFVRRITKLDKCLYQCVQFFASAKQNINAKPFSASKEFGVGMALSNNLEKKNSVTDDLD
jgi:hypothetical protein